MVKRHFGERPVKTILEKLGKNVAQLKENNNGEKKKNS
jgi:hypothetical protein